MNKPGWKRAGLTGFFLAGMVLFSVFTVSAEVVREITLTATGVSEKSIWSPLEIFAVKGETVRITLVNESEMMHGFNIKKFKIRVQVFGETERVVTFKAKKTGTFKIFCHFHKKQKKGILKIVKK